jgi:hypothetical protein
VFFIFSPLEGLLIPWIDEPTLADPRVLHAIERSSGPSNVAPCSTRTSFP